MSYRDHFKANMKVAVHSIAAALFHVAHAIVPSKYTSHDFWGLGFTDKH